MKQTEGCCRLADFGAELKDTALAETVHFPLLDQQLQQMAPGSLVLLDLGGVDFMGYGYAKQTVVECVRRLQDGRYPLRALLLGYDREDYATRLEALDTALAEFRLTMLLALEGRAALSALGYVQANRPFEGKREHQKRMKLLRVLNLMIDRRELYTNEVAAQLELTLPNSNYLLGELETMRLVERLKEASPTGGPIYLNRLLAPPPLAGA
ncbi:MAG: hypothetical protein ABIL09_19965 [Gemmatimonadota bacterium]